jgi:hypothetical protein
MRKAVLHGTDSAKDILLYDSLFNNFRGCMPKGATINKLVDGSIIVVVEGSVVYCMTQEAMAIQRVYLGLPMPEGLVLTFEEEDDDDQGTLFTN